MASCDNCGKEEAFVCKECRPIPLTERHLEMLRLMADGVTTKEAARTLYISESTLKREKRVMYGLFGLASDTRQEPAMLAQAFRKGLIR